MAMLVNVTEAGSFSAASRRMKVPLPTLSRKVSALEQLVGAQLLLRTTRKLSLTEAGTAYVAAARRILEQVDDAEKTAAGELSTPKGELVITAPAMFGRLHVLPLVTEFLAAYPAIAVRLVLSDRIVDLVDDHIDMAVRIGKLPASSIIATQVGTMRMVTVASPALLKKIGVPKTPDQLRDRPWIALETPTNSARLTVNSTDAALDAAIRGVGIARLLHYQVAAAVKRGELRIVLERHEPPPLPVHLVHAARAQMPVKMRRFLDAAVPSLRAILS